MRFAVARLDLLERSLARAYPVASLQQARFRQSGPYALQSATVFGMTPDCVAADARVLQHERIVSQSSGGSVRGTSRKYVAATALGTLAERENFNVSLGD